jgi:hypothetical protein
MPAPISVTENEQTWLKHYLQEIYDVVIFDAYDCQKLSVNVENQKNIKISTSTFRRLFDLVPNKNSSSRFMLNTLARTIDFKNWDTFKNHVTHFDINVINQNIQLYNSNPKSYQKLLFETIKNLPINSSIGAYQFQNIVSVAIENKDFELLEQIVFIPLDINNQNIYEHIVIGFQSFYFQSVKQNQEVIRFVEKNIGKSILLQRCLLEGYVNENYLDSFLGIWFEAVQENSLPDLLLFKNILLCQKAFNENNIPKAIQYLDIATTELNHSNNEIHPILKARIGVWEMILKGNSNAINDYFNRLENPFDIADFAVITSRLLWIYNSDKQKIDFLEAININVFPVVKNYFQKGRYNILLLTISINFYLNQEFENALKTFKLVDHNAFTYDIVNIDFYNPWIEKLKNI